MVTVEQLLAAITAKRAEAQQVAAAFEVEIQALQAAFDAADAAI